MRKLYLFVNNTAMGDWLDCLSLTDDGHILGNHICSHMYFMIHDLHNRNDRLEKIKNHFKNEKYEIEVLSYDDCKKNPKFIESLELAKALQHDFEKAGVTITYEKKQKIGKS